jgi:hypothetical protein
MRATEFILEGYEHMANVFPDGNLVLTDHLKQRLEQHGVDLARVIHIVRRASQRNKKELLAIQDHESIILEHPGLGVALLKVWNPQIEQFNYLVRTAHPTLKIGAGQHQIKVN